MCWPDEENSQPTDAGFMGVDPRLTSQKPRKVLSVVEQVQEAGLAGGYVAIIELHRGNPDAISHSSGSLECFPFLRGVALDCLSYSRSTSPQPLRREIEPMMISTCRKYVEWWHRKLASSDIYIYI